jgi:hypothetical protein
MGPAGTHRTSREDHRGRRRNALDGDLVVVVELASLAPSVHNTQPWSFTWDGVSLGVREDPARSLPVLDPSGRERIISCGAAVLHARLGFAERGWDVATAVLPDPDDPELLARLTVSAAASPPPRSTPWRRPSRSAAPTATPSTAPR